MTLSITKGRLESILALLHLWRKKSTCTKRELQAFIGKLCFVMKCVLQSRVFLNRLLTTLRAFGATNFVVINAEFQKDIMWWLTFMTEFNGVSVFPAAVWLEPDLVFATDSCLTGCGGLTELKYFHVRFPEWILEKGLSINVLEIIAVTVAVRLWGTQFTGLKVQVKCDNAASVAAINSGRTRDEFVGSCVRQLWLEIVRHRFELRAVHIAGVDNRLADYLSRWHTSGSFEKSFLDAVKDSGYEEVVVDACLFCFEDV